MFLNLQFWNISSLSLTEQFIRLVFLHFLIIIEIEQLWKGFYSVLLLVIYNHNSIIAPLLVT